MDMVQGKYILSTYYDFYVHFFYMLFSLWVDRINYLKSCIYKYMSTMSTMSTSNNTYISTSRLRDITNGKFKQSNCDGRSRP